MGKLFVHFSSISEAGAGLAAVVGRKFNGQIVKGDYYDEQAFVGGKYEYVQ